jgi:hypothetical protein
MQVPLIFIFDGKQIYPYFLYPPTGRPCKSDILIFQALEPPDFGQAGPREAYVVHSVISNYDTGIDACILEIIPQQDHGENLRTALELSRKLRDQLNKQQTLEAQRLSKDIEDKIRELKKKNGIT